MKKLLLLLTAAVLSLTSCNKDEDSTKNVKNVRTVNLDASSRTEWNYYSLSNNKLIGKGEDSKNSPWLKNKEWDIAINRYSIRTNSGESTTVNSKGGLYICEKGITFGNATLDKEDSFKVDKTFSVHGMRGVVKKIIKSEATVITFKRDDKGNMIMPPVYMKSPIYIFRSADGKKKFKVEFLSYKNSDGESGYVSYKYDEL